MKKLSDYIRLYNHSKKHFISILKEEFAGTEFHKKKLNINNGYICLKKKNFIQYWHITKMESIMKRKKHLDEHVHHIDKNKMNNKENNLMITKKEFHLKFHEFEKLGNPFCLKCGREGHLYNQCDYLKDINNENVLVNNHLNK